MNSLNANSLICVGRHRIVERKFGTRAGRLEAKKEIAGHVDHHQGTLEPIQTVRNLLDRFGKCATTDREGSIESKAGRHNVCAAHEEQKDQ